jgi:hypothetical protein
MPIFKYVRRKKEKLYFIPTPNPHHVIIYKKIILVTLDIIINKNKILNYFLIKKTYFSVNFLLLKKYFRKNVFTVFTANCLICKQIFSTKLKLKPAEDDIEGFINILVNSCYTFLETNLSKRKFSA